MKNTIYIAPYVGPFGKTGNFVQSSSRATIQRKVKEIISDSFAYDKNSNPNVVLEFVATVKNGKISLRQADKFHYISGEGKVIWKS
jgi:hypothetical protein